MKRSMNKREMWQKLCNLLLFIKCLRTQGTYYKLNIYKDNLSIKGKPSGHQESEKPCPLVADIITFCFP